MAEEPPEKKARLECDQDKIQQVQAAISSTELGMTWSSSLRELLLALAPGALEMQRADRTAKEEALLRMLDEIFAEEEERLKEFVEAAKGKGESATSKRTKSEEVVEAVQKNITELAEEAKEKWKPLGADALEVRSVEVKVLQAMAEAVAKQKDTINNLRRDCFEPLKEGSWSEDAEFQKHLAAIMPLFQHISDKPVLASCVGVLSRKPDARSTFDSKILEQLDQDLDKYTTSISEQESSLNSELTALQAGELAEQEISMEKAEQMLQEFKQLELGDEKQKALHVKQHTLQALKEGVESAAGQRKAIAALKRACRKLPDSKALLAKAIPALQHDASERTKPDENNIAKLEAAIDTRISTLEEQLKNRESVDGGDGKKAGVDLSALRALLDLETKEKAGKQKEAGKERSTLMELKTSTYEPLKDGTWEGNDISKGMVRSLNKLLKTLDIENAQLKTLTGVLKKRPADRAPFDEVLVQQVELSISKRVDALDQKLSLSDTTEKYAQLHEAVSAAESTQELLEEAREKQLTNLQAAINVETKRKKLESQLEEKRDIVKQMLEEEKTALDGHASAGDALGSFMRSRDALGSLRGVEVQRPVPAQTEEAPQEPVEADAPEQEVVETEAAPEPGVAEGTDAD